MPLIYLSACHKRNNGSLTDNVAKKKGKRDGSGEKYYRNRRLETISPEFPIVTRQGKYGTRKRTINESFRGPTDQSIDHLTRILPSFLSPRLFAAYRTRKSRFQIALSVFPHGSDRACSACPHTVSKCFYPEIGKCRLRAHCSHTPVFALWFSPKSVAELRVCNVRTIDPINTTKFSRRYLYIVQL